MPAAGGKSAIYPVFEHLCRRRSKMRPVRRSKTRPPVARFLVCRVLGSDAGQGVDAAVAEPVAGALEGHQGNANGFGWTLIVGWWASGRAFGVWCRRGRAGQS